MCNVWLKKQLIRSVVNTVGCSRDWIEMKFLKRCHKAFIYAYGRESNRSECNRHPDYFFSTFHVNDALQSIFPILIFSFWIEKCNIYSRVIKCKCVIEYIAYKMRSRAQAGGGLKFACMKWNAAVIRIGSLNVNNVHELRLAHCVCMYATQNGK